MHAWAQRLARARLLVLAALTYAYFFGGGDPNQATRYALTESLVERREPDITPYHAATIDKGFKRGKFYSDKAPGVSVLATVPYAVMRLGDRLFAIDPGSREAQLAKLHLLSFVTSGLAGVGCVWLVRRLAEHLGCGASIAELVAFGYAFGTIAFPFSTVAFGHQHAAFLVVASFYVLVRAV